MRLAAVVVVVGVVRVALDLNLEAGLDTAAFGNKGGLSATFLYSSTVAEAGAVSGRPKGAVNGRWNGGGARNGDMDVC